MLCAILTVYFAFCVLTDDSRFVIGFSALECQLQISQSARLKQTGCDLSSKQWKDEQEIGRKARELIPYQFYAFTRSAFVVFLLLSVIINLALARNL